MIYQMFTGHNRHIHMDERLTSSAEFLNITSDLGRSSINEPAYP